MAYRERIVEEPVVERETVVVERGSAGGLVAAIALLIAVVAILAYLGMLPISTKPLSPGGRGRTRSRSEWGGEGLARQAHAPTPLPGCFAARPSPARGEGQHVGVTATSPDS